MFVVKECTKCKEYKLLSEYQKDKYRLFGVHPSCKSCRNTNEKREYAKKYYYENIDKQRENSRKYRLKNLDRERAKGRDWYHKNVEHARKKSLEYSKSDNGRKLRNDREKKYLSNHLIKLKIYTRNSIRQKIKNGGYTKCSKTHKILGCSYEEFKVYIESQFTKGMSWENYGEWHLDHIYPVSLAKDEQHLIELNHYTNFQPLWAKENLSKGNKIVEKQLKLL